MPEMLPALDTFGQRVMILGPSNSGKSTLAVALGQRLGVPVVHLDLLRHAPDTDWVQRSDAEFQALHAKAIAEPSWVMEGNYGEIFAQRLARATGVIALDDRLFERYCRYFRRTLIERADRPGGLLGDKDSVKWSMIRWLWVSRHSARKYRHVARESGLPHVICDNRRQLDAVYASWDLQHPSRTS